MSVSACNELNDKVYTWTNCIQLTVRKCSLTTYEPSVSQALQFCHLLSHMYWLNSRGFHRLVERLDLELQRQEFTSTESQSRRFASQTSRYTCRWTGSHPAKL